MRYAVLFPGQGSQAVGMLGALGAAHPEVALTFAEASSALGWDVAALIGQGPAEELNRTERTQPALLAAGVAAWRVWQKSCSTPPAAAAGHSLGEYTALVAAGSLGFAEALGLVELRGQLMQQAVPAGKGGMVAVVGLEDAALEALCRQNPGLGVLEPVNYNAPGQVVVAGEAAALDWLEANAKAGGARMTVRLPVSVPSHCSLMRGAAETLAGHLSTLTLRAPAFPVIHNRDAQPHPQAEAMRTALREQLYSPVRWTQTLQVLAGSGVTTYLECGPGKVLAGLSKRGLPKGTQTFTLEDPAQLMLAAQTIGAAP